MGKSGSGEAGRCVKRSPFREKELAHEAIGTFVIFQDQECVFVSKLTPTGPHLLRTNGSCLTLRGNKPTKRSHQPPINRIYLRHPPFASEAAMH